MKFKVRMQNWTHLQFNNSVRTCVLEVQWHSELTTCHCITTLELPSCKPLGYLPSQKHCPQKQNGKSKAVRDWGRLFYKKVVTVLPLQNCSHSNEHVLSGWTCKIESLQLQTMCQSASCPVQKMQARNPQLIFLHQNAWSSQSCQIEFLLQWHSRDWTILLLHSQLLNFNARIAYARFCTKQLETATPKSSG